MSLLGGARGVPGVWRSAGHLLQPGGQGRLPGRGEAGLRLDAGSWVLGPRAGGPCPGLRLTRPEAPCLPLTSPWTSPHPHLCHCHPVHLVALPQTPAFEVLAHLVASPKCCLIQEASPSVVPGGPLLLHPQLSLRPSMTAHSSHMAVTPVFFRSQTLSSSGPHSTLCPQSVPPQGTPRWWHRLAKLSGVAPSPSSECRSTGHAWVPGRLCPALNIRLRGCHLTLRGLSFHTRDTKALPSSRVPRGWRGGAHRGKVLTTHSSLAPDSPSPAWGGDPTATVPSHRLACEPGIRHHTAI